MFSVYDFIMTYEYHLVLVYNVYSNIPLACKYFPVTDGIKVLNLEYLNNLTNLDEIII